MRPAWVILCFLLIGALLVGCGQQPTPGPTPTPSPKPTTAPPPAASPSPTAKPSPAPSPAATVKTGGTIRYWNSGTPGGFDAHRKAAYSPVVSLLVFNNLVKFDMNKPELSPANIVPDLAEKWDVSADGLTYTFYLSKNVKWHDGKPFTADDVVYSIEKMVDPKRSALTGSLKSFSGVQKVDDYTVKITLKTPQPSFLVQMAGAYAPMQAKHKADVNFQVTDFLMGTGPFKFSRGTSGVSYEFVKNPDYFKKGLPYLDGVNIAIIPDRSAQVDAFVSNRVDMMCPHSGITNFEVLDRMRQQAKDAIIKPEPLPYGTEFWLNMGSANLKDVRVRKALALLVDPKMVITAGFGSDDFANYEYQLLPPPYAMPKADREKLLGRDKPFDQRVTEAQKLMADAGFANGMKLKIVTFKLPENEGRVNIVADQWRRYLKIDTQLAVLETSEARKARDTGDYDVYFDNALALLGDPDDLMPIFVSSDPANYTKYSNPAVDKLWQDQSRTVDLSKRIQITQQIERQLLTDLPVIPTTFTQWQLAWKPYVKGFIPHNSIYGPEMTMEVMWMDK